MSRDSLVVVPTLNEAASIDRLLGVLLDQGSADVLVIDDGSDDGTSERLAAWQARAPERLRVIQRGRRLGLGTALALGYRHALAGDYMRLVQMDADLSHDPRTVPALLDALRGADLVIGSRYVRGGRTVGWPRRRALLSWAARLLARTLAGVPVADMTSGFRAFRRAALETIDPPSLRARGYSIQVETTVRAHRAGLRIREVPIVFRERRDGASKMDLRVLLEWGATVWRIRRQSAVGSRQ